MDYKRNITKAKSLTYPKLRSSYPAFKPSTQANTRVKNRKKNRKNLIPKLDVKSLNPSKRKNSRDKCVRSEKFQPIDFFSLAQPHGVHNTDSIPSDVSEHVSSSETVDRSGVDTSEKRSFVVTEKFAKEGGFIRLFAENLKKNSKRVSVKEQNEFMKKIKVLYQQSGYETL